MEGGSGTLPEIGEVSNITASRATNNTFNTILGS